MSASNTQVHFKPDFMEADTMNPDQNEQSDLGDFPTFLKLGPGACLICENFV